MDTAVTIVRVGVFLTLVGCLLATPDVPDVPVTRRFHAKFVVDRVEPRRPQSTDERSTPSGGFEPLPAVRTRSTTRCREGCLQKRSIKDILCTQQRECSMCWDVCNRNHQIRKENELSHRLLLSLVRLIRNESVVTADIEWATPEELVQNQPHPVVPSPLAASENVERLSRIARADVGARDGTSRILQTLVGQQDEGRGRFGDVSPTEEGPTTQEYHQCLVSWEISGGGLTGNLLTETSKVELSLWPNTKYHVHVTCRNKETDSLIRSSSLLVDTSEAVIVSLQGTTSTAMPEVVPRLVEDVAINTPIQPLGSNRLDSDVPADDDDLRDFPEQQQQQQQQQQQREAIRRHHSFWPFDGTSGELGGSSPDSSKEIVILGVFVALLALVLIALTVVILVRRKPGPLEDRELLIENEVLPKILHV